MPWSQNFTSKQYISLRFRLVPTCLTHLCSFSTLNLIIFVNIGDFLFFASFVFSFILSMKFTLCNSLELRIYFRTVYFAYFPPPYNLYYIDFVALKSNNSLKYNQFSHFTPFSFIVCLKFTLCGVVDIQRILQDSMFCIFFASLQLILYISEVVAP